MDPCKTVERCDTCKWWYRFADEDPVWGKCVWHTGVKNTTAQRVRFGGTFETRHDFLCVRHELYAEGKQET